MKRSAKICSAALCEPMRRDHLRFASMITAIETMTTMQIGYLVMGLILSAIVFAWDILYLFIDTAEDVAGKVTHDDPIV